MRHRGAIEISIGALGMGSWEKNLELSRAIEEVARRTGKSVNISFVNEALNPPLELPPADDALSLPQWKPKRIDHVLPAGLSRGPQRKNKHR